MRVAEVCKYAPNYGGNFVESLKVLATRVKKANDNNEVLFFFPKDAKGKPWVEALQQDYQVFFLPQGRFRCNMELVRSCYRYKVDIMHIHFYGLISCFMVGWFSKTKVVNHFHNTLETSGKLKMVILNFLSLSSRQLVGCSNAVYETLLKVFPHAKCSYITNCIDFSRLDRIKKENPFNNKKKNILILGSDFYRKGVDSALRAIEKVQERFDVCLQIVTHTPEETRNECVKVLGYEAKWVHVVSPVENIGDYYRASDLFISPSVAEGLCYAIPEALYCNCMVLKTDIPSMCYELEGESEITISSVECLANRIIEIFQDEKHFYDNVVASLREQVIQKYDISKWGSEVFDLYLCLMK